MNVVDSSGWLEYFGDGPNADFFASGIETVPELVVSSISIYEVFKRVLQQRGEGDALQAVAMMQQGLLVDLDADIALRAASMADSVILATARAHETPRYGLRTRTSKVWRASGTSRRESGGDAGHRPLSDLSATIPYGRDRL